MMKMNKTTYFILVMSLIFTAAFIFSGCSDGEETLPGDHWYVEGLYLKCDNDADMILIENYGGEGSLTPCSMTAENDGVSFDGLTSGDRIKIEVMLMGETYPMQTQVYSLEKLSDGEYGDIDAELLSQLSQMGWTSTDYNAAVFD